MERLVGRFDQIALYYPNKFDRLDEFADQLADVTLENLDWSEVFEKYDSEGTVFYCDPPHVGYEDTYLVNTIGHAALVDGLAGLEGDWICSYEDLPEGLETCTCSIGMRHGSSTTGRRDRRRTRKNVL